jgi:hypothetical protein
LPEVCGEAVAGEDPYAEEGGQDLLASPYLITSPESQKETSSSRVLKRIKSRLEQRRAALDLDPQVCFSSTPARETSSRCSYTKQSSEKLSVLRRPVLEPSIFFLEKFNPTEWITIHRWKKKIVHIFFKKS